MKMVEVITLFENEGMKNISSVLASGNIIFSSEKNAKELKKILEKGMSEHFSYEAFLFVKSLTEIDTIFHNNPFEREPKYHIYTFVGIEGIDETLMSEFNKSKKVSGEEAQLVNGSFYWRVPKGNTLGSEFGNILGRKNLKDTFTSRNINTLEKVLKKL